MTQDQTSAIENLDRAAARLLAAKQEMIEATKDHRLAVQRAQQKVPNLFVKPEPEYFADSDD